MKKGLKIVFGIIIVIVLCLVIDLICVFTLNSPLFAVRENNGDSVDIIYRGVFYDTYNCHELSKPQIKSKSSKFSCSIKKNNSLDVIEINWYIDFDEDNDYILCDNEDKDIDNGVCYIGNYKIIGGEISKNPTIELYLDHYYKDGGYIAVDVDGPRTINLEHNEKYKNNIISIEKRSEEVYLINLVEQIKYDFNK